MSAKFGAQDSSAGLSPRALHTVRAFVFSGSKTTASGAMYSRKAVFVPFSPAILAKDRSVSIILSRSDCAAVPITRQGKNISAKNNFIMEKAPRRLANHLGAL